MRTEQRTIYIADDGEEFTDEAACLKHELVDQLAKHLINREVLFSSNDCEEVAAVMHEHYVVIPRDKLHQLVPGLRKAITYLSNMEAIAPPTDNTFDSMLGPLGEIDELLNT